MAYVAAAGCLLALLPAASAGAATDLHQRGGEAGCVTENGVPGQCQNGRGLVGPADIALSPDGQNAYVASAAWNSLAILTRNPADGTLAPGAGPGGCFHSLGSLYPDCTEARELGGARGLAVSPDGKSVYVAAPSDDALLIFDRDPETGALSLSEADDGCFNSSGSNSCAEGRILDDASGVVVSPDNQNVYVASGGTQGGIAVFDRDPETGDLSQKAGAEGCINDAGQDGCTDGLTQMLGAEQVEISPDGEILYALSPARDAVTLYERDDATGALTPVGAPAGCVEKDGADGCATGTGLIEPASLTIGPDNETAYVAAERADAILTFDRDPSSGELVQKAGTAACISNTGLSDPMQADTVGDCVNGVAMDGVSSVAVLPDGTALYATTVESSGVAVFERLPNGELSQRPGTAGCVTETGFEDSVLPWTAGVCQDGRGLQRASSVTVSSDSLHAYTTASQGGIGIFDVVEPPPAPPPPPPPPPPTPPAPEGPECEEARKAERRLARALPRNQRLMRRQIRKARQAKTAAEEARHRKAARRTRKRTRVLRRAWLRVSRLALSACYR